MSNAADRLSLARWEADRHVAALDQARADWRALPAPTWQDIEQDDQLRRLTDQIFFRFMKLQDASGERLIPATLSELREPFEEWPMRDRLDQPRKAGLSRCRALAALARGSKSSRARVSRCAGDAPCRPALCHCRRRVD